MNRSEWLACVRELAAELDEAQRCGQEARRIGTIMALEAVLQIEPTEDEAHDGNAAKDI